MIGTKHGVNVSIDPLSAELVQCLFDANPSIVLRGARRGANTQDVRYPSISNVPIRSIAFLMFSVELAYEKRM